MSDIPNPNAAASGDGNPPAIPAAPAPASPAAPAPPAPAAPQHASPAAPQVNFGEILTAIQAMPEAIVRSLREATQPPKPSTPAPTGDSAGSSAAGSQGASQGGSSPAPAAAKKTEPTKKTLAQRWFG